MRVCWGGLCISGLEVVIACICFFRFSCCFRVASCCRLQTKPAKDGVFRGPEKLRFSPALVRSCVAHSPFIHCQRQAFRCSRSLRSRGHQGTATAHMTPQPTVLLGHGPAMPATVARRSARCVASCKPRPSHAFADEPPGVLPSGSHQHAPHSLIGQPNGCASAFARGVSVSEHRGHPRAGGEEWGNCGFGAEAAVCCLELRKIPKKTAQQNQKPIQKLRQKIPKPLLAGAVVIAGPKLGFHQPIRRGDVTRTIHAGRQIVHVLEPAG